MEKMESVERDFTVRVAEAPHGKSSRRNLLGQVALVTGGCRGIGKAISLALAEEGAHVAINCRNSYQCSEAQKLQDFIKKDGGAASLWPADVSKREQVHFLKEKFLKEFDRIDILVNNAGITQDKSFAKMEVEQWDEVLAVNLHGAFNCIKSFVNVMLTRKYGRIVNIASVVGQAGNFGQANYAAAKAGLIGLTKTLAKELASKRITVNAVAPGFIETEMLFSMREDIRGKILSQIPMERFGQPDEVARLVRFLVAEGDYISGQVIAINGGLYV